MCRVTATKLQVTLGRQTRDLGTARMVSPPSRGKHEGAERLAAARRRTRHPLGIARRGRDGREFAAAAVGFEPRDAETPRREIFYWI